jgi:predicted Zn-dependent protease with MMP-like domain
VTRALDGVPEPFASYLANVVVVVEDEPDQATREAFGSILGLYEGVPLTAGDEGFAPALPPRITVYQGPHLRACRSLSELQAEVRDTVLHEIAHQFGMDDTDLDAMGPLQ